MEFRYMLISFKLGNDDALDYRSTFSVDNPESHDTLFSCIIDELSQEGLGILWVKGVKIEFILEFDSPNLVHIYRYNTIYYIVKGL